jgi:3-hydroxyacyl-[acyl-carrier-protein] dehydratase
MTKINYVDMQPNKGKFQFIGEVQSLESGKSIEVIWKLSPSYWFFEDHWPDNPTVPAVIQLEAIFQNSALIYFTRSQNTEKFIYVARIIDASFHKKLVPGDIVTIHSTAMKGKRGFHKIESLMKRQGEIICKCHFEIFLESESLHG